MSTKIAVIASDENTVLAVDVVPGQANDAPRLKPLLQRTVARLQPNAVPPVLPPVLPLVAC